MRLYLDVIIKNYFNFNGRARRKEFWSYLVVHVLVILFCYFIHNKFFYLYFLFSSEKDIILVWFKKVS